MDGYELQAVWKEGKDVTSSEEIARVMERVGLDAKTHLAAAESAEVLFLAFQMPIFFKKIIGHI